MTTSQRAALNAAIAEYFAGLSAREQAFIHTNIRDVDDLIDAIAPHFPAPDALAGDYAAGVLRGTPYEAAMEASQLAEKWEERGVIVTIERAPRKPLAMGNHIAVTQARPKRENTND